MIVSMRRGSDWCTVRLAGSVLGEIENHKLVRSKDWADRARGLAEAHKVIARRTKNGWSEDGRTDEDAFAVVLAALAKKQEHWRGFGDGVTASIWCSGHIPASAESVARIADVHYRNFLLSTNGFILRARFEKHGYRADAVTTFFKAQQPTLLDVASAYPSVGGTIEQVDVIDPHLNILDELSGAVLQSDGRVTAWRDGKASGEHEDFRAYFRAWLSKFDSVVLDTWADVARR